jgi:Secretion system C-terminal sorting domain
LHYYLQLTETMRNKYILFGFAMMGMTCVFGQVQEEPTVEYVQGKFLGITPPISEWKGAEVDFSNIMAKEGNVKENRRRPEADPDKKDISVDEALQETYGTAMNRAPIVNFDGMNGAFPPDPTGAAGPNHYVQAVNSSYRVYSKTGTALTGALPLASLWPGSSSDGDPIVMYDRHADRWVITQFQISGNEILFAVSTTPSPTGSYATYSYSFTSFPDYPKYSIWSDGYYMTSNSSNKNAVAFDRTAMLAGSATAGMVALNLPSFATQYGFKSVLPADADGALPPFGTPNYMFYFQDNNWSGVSQDVIKILKMQVNWTNPTASTITVHQTLFPTAFNAVFTNSWDDITQKNSTQKLDAIASVFNYRAQYIRWGAYNTVMLCKVVDVDNANKGGIRWYELRQDNATNQFAIHQQGTYAPAGTDSRWLGSIAMDLNGMIGMGYSIAGPDRFASLAYTGRFPFDPPGVMTIQEFIAVNGTAAQSGGNRFGDYSHLSLDPDGKTFWFTGEYIGSGGTRKTRIFSFDIFSTLNTPQKNIMELEMVAFQKQNNLNVQMEGVQFTNELRVELLEMSGRSIRVSNEKVNDEKLDVSWDISSLAKGTYIVAVSGESFQRTQKIVIQ